MVSVRIVDVFKIVEVQHAQIEYRLIVPIGAVLVLYKRFLQKFVSPVSVWQIGQAVGAALPFNDFIFCF